MSSLEQAHPAISFVIEPHLETAIWAIIGALICILALILSDMVKKYIGKAPPGDPHHVKKSGRKRK